LNELLGEIIEFAANHTDMRSVTIQSQFEKGLPCIMLDGDQMRQVAINLILNAGGAMPEGGTLNITTEVGPEQPSKFASVIPVTEFPGKSGKDFRTVLHHQSPWHRSGAGHYPSNY
jgi:signal transduction histidine kinase